jgi:hypothetical protein
MTIETTYFLGAGASKAFYPTLPLASGMTLEYLLNRRGLPIGFDQAIELVEQYMADQCWPKEKRLIPFEQIYLEFPENRKPLYPREHLELCLFRKLSLENPAPPSGHNPWLEESLNCGHAILTTNYDTLIEWWVENLHIAPIGGEHSGLVDYGVPDHLCFPMPSAGPRLDGRGEKLLLLKLYGSISWSRCEDCDKFLLERIHQHGGENAMMGRGKCPGCDGARRNAVFVPLVGQKSPTDTALQAIWAKAEQVLSESCQIVFAGFSLNPDDRSIRDLLGRALSAGYTSNVTVVLNRSHPEIIKRYREIYGDCVQSYESGWVQYLRERSQAHQKS